MDELDERTISRLDLAARITGWIVVTLLFVLVCWYWIDRFATYGIIGSAFTILATIAYWTRLRPRR